MMERTKIYKALKGVRGRKSVDLPALEQLLVQFGQLVAEQRWIKEIDINPLLASSDRLVALDARVVLHEPEMTEDRLPKLAIRPYPMQYVQPWTMKNGMELAIRPIRPEDEPLMVKYHEKLSAHTVYLRYFQNLELGRRVEHERLTRICFIDYDREMALVAERTDPKTGEREIVAVGRLSKLHDANEAEYAIMVSDEFQASGLGTELLRRLLQVAREEKLDKVSAYMLLENVAMRRVSEKLGFKMHYDEQQQLVKGEIDLTETAPAQPVIVD
jgi:acetyltransferase